jgi:hypothetical protein
LLSALLEGIAISDYENKIIYAEQVKIQSIQPSKSSIAYILIVKKIKSKEFYTYKSE